MRHRTWTGSRPPYTSSAFFAEQIEQLGVAHGDQEVKAIVRVAHNQEQGGFPVSQGIQLQLVVGSDLPQLRNVEHGKARTAGNQDGFCGFARSQLVLFVLADGEVVGLLASSASNIRSTGVFELLVILPHPHLIVELDGGGEILLPRGPLVVEFPNKGAIQTPPPPRHRPPPPLPPPLGVGVPAVELQNVLLEWM